MAMASTGLSEGVVCYPTSLLDEKREICLEIISTLSNLGFDPHRLRLIDKGTDSVLLMPDREDVVIKARRLDGPRLLSREGYIMLFINYMSKSKLSPRVYSFNTHVIVMEYVKGYPIRDIDRAVGGDLKEKRRVACLSLLKAIELDRLGVDHGQLSRAYEHVLVRLSDREPIFVDFGDARLTSEPHNASSLWSYLKNRGLLEGLTEASNLKVARGLKRGDQRAQELISQECLSYI